jgi:SPP1 family predicted phage head-tail adaptor
LLSGRLNHKIVIQERTETKNSVGEDITTWDTYKWTWAQVTPLTGKEYFSKNEFQSTITNKIYMRYLTGVTPDMRIVWDSRTFDIISVINTDERNRELILMVEEQL